MDGQNYQRYSCQEGFVLGRVRGGGAGSMTNCTGVRRRFYEKGSKKCFIKWKAFLRKGTKTKRT